MAEEEFCGAYKGDHSFEEGSNQCRCGRAFLRAPRPVPDWHGDHPHRVAARAERDARYRDQP